MFRVYHRLTPRFLSVLLLRIKTCLTNSTTLRLLLKPATTSIGANFELQMKLQDLPQDNLFSPAAQQQHLQQTTPREGSLALSPSALVSPTVTGSNPPSKESSPDGTASNTSGTDSGVMDGIDRLFVAGVGCMKSQTAAYIEKHQGEDVVLAKTGVVKLIHNDKEAMVVLPSEVRSRRNRKSLSRFRHFNLTDRDHYNIYLTMGHDVKATSELATTADMSETLKKALGVKEEIVGLQTNAVVLDESEGAIFKHHGQVS